MSAGRPNRTAHTSGRRARAGRDGTDLLGGLPTRGVGDVDPTGGPTAEEERDHDHQAEDRVEHERALGVLEDAGLEDAEREGRRDDGDEVGEPADEQGRQRLEQHAEGQRGGDRQTDLARSQVDRHEREQRRDHPHHGLDPAYRHAEEGDAVGAVGGGPDGGAHGAALEEEAEGQDGDRDDEGDLQVGAVEDDPVDLDARVQEGRQLRSDQTGLVEGPGEEDRHRREHLRQAQGRDGEEQAGRAGEPADDEELDGGAEDDRPEHAGARRQPKWPAGHGDEEVHEDDRRRAGVGVGEVDDAVGPVGEGHPDGDQGRRTADHEAVDPLPERQGEQHELYHHDGERGHEWSCGATYRRWCVDGYWCQPLVPPEDSRRTVQGSRVGWWLGYGLRVPGLWRSLVSALDWGSRGRRFESSQPDGEGGPDQHIRSGPLCVRSRPRSPRSPTESQRSPPARVRWRPQKT